MKYLLTLAISLFLVSCGPNSVPPHDSTADSKELSEFPVKSNLTNKTPLEVLGIYTTTGGNLYVYKLGNDTIYWAEGRSSSYPVSLQIK